MDSTAVRLIIEKLEVVGAKGASFAWPLLVRHELVSGWLTLLAGIVTVVGGAALWGWAGSYKLQNEYDDAAGTARVGGTILFVIGGIATFCALGQVICPECSALRALLP